MGRGRFSLEAILTLKDQMSLGMNQTGHRMTRASRAIGRQMRDLSVPIQRVNTGLNRAFRVVGTAAVAAFGASVVVATREFVRFDQAITQAGAKFTDLDVTSADYAERLEEIGRTARDVASVTEFMATDTAGALDKMAMAGMSSQLSMSLLRGTTDLATAAGTDLTTAVDIVTDSMGAFGLATEDAAQAERNLARLSDVMVRTTTSANTSFEDLFEAVKKGAPAFTAAGQSVESFNALAGALANSGLKGSEAGTNLRNIMLRLANPTGAAADTLRQLGVQTQDAEGNFRDVVDILADFEDGLRGMGTQQRSAALSTVFGARAVTGVNILLQEGTESLRAYRTQLEESGGAATTMAEAMRQSLGNRIEVLKSGLMELGFRFVEVFEEQGRDALDNLITAVQNFDPQPVIDFFLRAIEFGTAAFQVIRRIWPVLVGLAAGIKAVAFATGTLNIALGATPIGWIIAGVAGLVTGLILLARHWDAVKNAVVRVWNWFSTLLDNPLIAAAGMVFAPWITIPAMIVKHWELIRTFFSDLFGWIGDTWDRTVGRIMGMVDRLKNSSVVEFLTGNQVTMEEGRQRNAERYGMTADMYSDPRTRVAESRSYSERVSRSELYVRPDRGAAISRRPGGAPEPSLALGAQ